MIEIVEGCPYCELEAYSNIASIKELVKTKGFVICEHCGKAILVCSECEHVNTCNTDGCFTLHHDWT